MPEAGEGPPPHVGFAPGLTTGCAPSPSSWSAAFALLRPDALSSPLLWSLGRPHNTRRYAPYLAGGPSWSGRGSTGLRPLTWVC